MTEPQGLPLVLGGHSFISQLGSDPPASADAQVMIVEACLDNGIHWFDTTYQPERVALGNALQVLGRRGEATLIAWNFFTEFGPGEEVGGPDYYQPHHIEQILAQLQTDAVECLVIHPLQDPGENARQVELAMAWQARGYVKHLGIWHPELDQMTSAGRVKPYGFMVRPYNITTRDAAPAFTAAKRLGLQTLACSPFVRGWELDRLVQRAMASEPSGEPALRARLADTMLRYSLFQPGVDRLIVSIRKPEWVLRNVESYRQGPLTRDERLWLDALSTLAEN